MTVSIYMPYSGPTWPGPDQPIDTAEFAALVKDLRARNKLVHGHALLYPVVNTDLGWWMKQDDSLVEERMYQYMEAVVQSTRPAVNSGSSSKGNPIWTWDVVNEDMADVDQPSEQQDSDGIRIQTWVGVPLKEYQAMGQDYIRMAFYRARALDPAAQLLMTDYGIESDDPNTDNDKADKLYRFVTKLRSEGVPIDGIGMQMHISALPGQEVNVTQIAANFERFRNAGLKFLLQKWMPFPTKRTTLPKCPPMR
jgi:endo-1,4-beta-xylanase